MTQFNTTRFLSVAKWDLAINRQFYTKAALVILLIMALPALGSLLQFATLRPVGAYTFMHDPTASVATSTIRCYFAMLPILVGYMLHNLRHRQGRILELTLPATNLEKWLWHTCLTLVGSLCVAVVSFLLIDLVYNLCIGLLAGFSFTKEFIVSIVRMARYHNAAYDIYGGIGWRATCITVLLYVLMLSTFVLGNAWKYRHNVVLTIAWDMAFLFVTFIATGIALSRFMIYFIEEHHNAVYRMADFIDSPASAVAFILLLLCLIVICWAWAYSLYRRATITSRRNL